MVDKKQKIGLYTKTKKKNKKLMHEKKITNLQVANRLFGFSKHK